MGRRPHARGRGEPTRVLIVSTHRADRGHLWPLRKLLGADPRFDVTAVFKFGGHTYNWAGCPGNAVPLRSIVHPEKGRDGFDAGIVLGDRLEMLIAATQVVEERIPLVHIHGGEHTYGSLDERWRWAISAIADVHCVAHDEAAWQVRKHFLDSLPPVHVTGAPGLDGIAPRRAVAIPPVMVHYNPALDATTTQSEQAAIYEALGGIDHVWVRPNGDRYSELIMGGREWSEAEDYRDALGSARVIVGNSSAGIIEAPSLGIWTVNVGERQAGRLRAANVIDVAGEPAAIRDGVLAAFDRPRFSGPNPYGDGHASERIRDVLLEMA